LTQSPTNVSLPGAVSSIGGKILRVEIPPVAKCVNMTSVNTFL